MLKKIATVLFASMIVTVGLNASVAKAAGDSVIIHVKDEANWGAMNVYNWGDAGETAGVWPGAAMEEEGDDWYTYTFTTEVDLNLVFSTANGSPQSNNIDGLSKSIGECWIVVGGEGEENDLGVKGASAVLYEEPEDGWPVAATAKVQEAAQDDTPATGDASPVVPVTIAGLLAFVIIIITFIKKKNIKSK